MAKTWKDRLVKEERKLNDKIDELASFIEGRHGEFRALKEVDRDLLMTQHAAMMTYLNVLAMRMKRLGLLETEKCTKIKTHEMSVGSMKDFLDHVIKEKRKSEAKEDGGNS